MTSTHYTRRRSTTAAIMVVLALVFAPALTPAALAYDADASGPDDTAMRFILPDWDVLDGGIDPFDGSLIPRRAMEHPRDGMSDYFWWGAAGACLYFGCSPALSWMVWGGTGVSLLGFNPQPMENPGCTATHPGNCMHMP